VEFKRVTILAVDSTNPTTLYTGTDADGVFKSTTAGREWKSANTGLPKTHVNALAIDLRAPATLYAGTDDGLFKSTNGGGAGHRLTWALPSRCSCVYRRD